MDATHLSTMFRDDAPLGKRRRFVPDQQLYLVPSDGCQQAIDSPLLLQPSEQMPTPAEIERELLQVGMRIRKSVNDGYKKIAFTPRPFFNMNRLSPETQAALCSGTLNRQPISTATFCGVSLAALAHVTSTPVEEQKMWSYSTSHKRGYEGDSDSDDQEFMPQTPTLDGRDAQMAIPIDYFNIEFDGSEDWSKVTKSGAPVDQQVSGRRLAQPRSRRRQQQHPNVPLSHQEHSNPFAQLQMASSMSGTQWMGHKRVTSCSVEANMWLHDFGEASFLQRREDVEMDCS